MAKLWVLQDNTVSGEAPNKGALVSAHGLSMALLTEEEKLLLWDTGPDDGFLRNAAVLSEADPELPPLTDADLIACSHGHYDHSGGLPALRKAGCTAPIYAYPRALHARYRKLPDGGKREIGWRGGEEGAKLHAVGDVLRLLPDVEMHTHFPREPGRFQAVDNFFLDRDCTEPDTVEDDAALLVEGENGASVILGCCHSGLRNTLQAMWLRSGAASIHTVVGGLHLSNAPEYAVEETVQTLLDYGVERIFAGHCTGDAARKQLQEKLPGKVFPLGVGQKIAL